MKVIRFILKATAIALAVFVIAVAASFAVSNRAPVAISLWPLPFQATLPLGTTLLAALAAGILIGTALMSVSRLRLWFRARRNERKAAALERSARRSAADQEQPAPAARTALPSPAPRPALSEN